jgi:hypothetical protein
LEPPGAGREIGSKYRPAHGLVSLVHQVTDLVHWSALIRNSPRFAIRTGEGDFSIFRTGKLRETECRDYKHPTQLLYSTP